MKLFLYFTKKYAVQYWKWYALGLFCLVTYQYLYMHIIMLLKQAIDDIVHVPHIVGQICFCAFILIFFRIGSRLFYFIPARYIEADICDDYFHQLMQLERKFYASHQSGDLLSRCTQDIQSVRASYGYGILQIANVLVTLAFGFTAMLQMNVRITAYFIFPITLSLVAIRFNLLSLRPHWKNANIQLGDISAYTLASIEGIAVIQSCQAEQNIHKKFLQLNQKNMQTNLSIVKISSFFMPILKVSSGLATFLMIWFVGHAILEKQLTIGQLTAFLGYIAMVLPCIHMLGWMLNVFFQAIPAMERIQEILQEPIPIYPKQLSYNNPLYVKNLNFSYTPTPFLENISFHIPSGKSLGIIGKIGSGKTTLLDVILRFHTLQKQQIYIHDQDVAETNISEYQKLYSYAPQNAFLFSRTLRENLLLAIPENQRPHDKIQCEKKLLHALQLACFPLEKQDFPQGLDTIIGEKGITLSGGQRQRVALARALLKPAQFYILDDVLSAVDVETERKIIQNLQKFAVNKNIIIVSHRISAVQWTDEILILHQGKISHQGNHQFLLQNSSYYQQIYEYSYSHH